MFSLREGLTLKLVGYVPMELSFLIFTFRKKVGSENKVQVKVNGSRRLETNLLSLDPNPRQNDRPSNQHKT